MRGAVHLEPLRGRDLVGADHGPDLVVEHLGGGAGERGEPLVAEPFEVVAERDAESRGALPDLECAEGVDVQVGHRILDRPNHGDVVVTVEGRVDPALETDLGRSACPRPRRPGGRSPRAARDTGSPRRFAASFPFENAQKPQRK